MASDKVLYAVRMPKDLKRHMDTEARKCNTKTSALVIAACWLYLEDGNRATAGIEQSVGCPPDGFSVGNRDLSFPPKHDLAALRDICAGNTITAKTEVTAFDLSVEEAIHRIVKVCAVCESPMREVAGKWACQDVSCGKYGVEQKVRA